MTAKEIMAQLEGYGNEGTKNILMKHGAKEPAYWSYLSEYTVPWVASETDFGIELGLEWIESKKETIAAAGWSTLASCASVKDDSDLDLKLYKKLLKRAEKEVHTAQNRVRYTMNGFIIAVGAYITDLTDEAKAIGERVGKVDVDVNGTACKVPLIPVSIGKVEARGSLGKKRKTARC